MRHRARMALAVSLLAASVLCPRAPRASAAGDLSFTAGLPETVEAIDHARVTTRILCITAHPDDEPASLLTYLARGLGANVALLSITRGEGGQNAIGPEQGAQLAVLRSHELLEATRIYGTRLVFTRAPDTGFVKTVEETKKIWGDRALADMVHVIRTFQPNVVVNSWGGMHEGHGHHQTAGLLTPQAAAAAADPAQFSDGLPPWHVDQILERYRGEGEKGYAPPLEQISPLWGRTYVEIGREGDYQHRTQGIAGFLTGPVPRFFRVRLLDEQGNAPDPARFAETLPALAERYPALSTSGGWLGRANQSLDDARQAALSLDWTATTHRLASAGKEIRAAADGIARNAEIPTAQKQAAEHELQGVEQRIQYALRLAAGLHIEAQASRREAIPGETFTVSVGERYRKGALDRIEPVQLLLPAGWTASEKTIQEGTAGEARYEVHVPLATQPQRAADDWMFPEPPPLVRVRVEANVSGYTFPAEVAVAAVRASSTQVEVQPLQMVPRVTLALEPRQMLVVPTRRGDSLEVVARVHYYGSQPAQMKVGLATPAQWPAVAPVTLKFEGPDDQLARLRIAVPPDGGAASVALAAYARTDSQQFHDSVEPLPSLQARLWSEPAQVKLCLLDLAVPDRLRVGYVAAENDPIPAILREIGIQVELLDPVALAFDDLSRFDAVVVGIRAYELRGDLPRANRRLLEYAAAGGALVVQYQRADDWNRIMPGPFPAKVGQPTLRVTDRNSPVRFLAPEHPVLHFPNAIRPEDFDGWVQERGLYFIGQRDAKYTPILALRDPGEEELDGGLLVARTGKGSYIYTGLSFFRQLPEGVNGALRLFVNLLCTARAQQQGAAH